MPQPALGVLVPAFEPDRPGVPPEARPLGRAALRLQAEGIDVVFGDSFADGCMTGWRARTGAWEAARAVPVAAVHDRFPSQGRADRFAEVVSALGGLPLANPPAVTGLCRDKLSSQRFLEAAGIQMPPVEADPTRFVPRLTEWGSAFLKPRFGALGAGVRRVEPGDALPARIVGLLADRDEPALLQRAVPPPTGLAGCSVRLLCQRLPGGGWFVDEGVARTSAIDPVVNAARGATVGPAAAALSVPTRRRARDLARAVCGAFAAHADGDLVVELGIDLVVDEGGQPHVIEVNSRPRGRLAVLADQDPASWWDHHVAACARPLRYLAGLAP